MTVTVDASVWVAATSDAEPHHAECLDFLGRAIGAQLVLDQPALSLVEVAASIARKTRSTALGIEAAGAMLATPGLVLHPLDLDLSGMAAEVAAASFLRSADAVYVATARRAGVPLVTLDAELAERARPFVTTLRPAEWNARPA